ncbi:hypothetical protein ACEZCY_14600 [Streptacidiphilus sp. N1-12]|uniref:Uncharacterized protein n=2 Tax=Streptacidiphilus alkalitolerans TaxID=3342712 RepID=A0ABV6WEI6_9ACTN
MKIWLHFNDQLGDIVTELPAVPRVGDGLDWTENHKTLDYRVVAVQWHASLLGSGRTAGVTVRLERLPDPDPDEA